MKFIEIYQKNHNKFFDNIILKKRLEMINIVNQLIIKNDILDVLDIGTTSDNKNLSSNFVIKHLENAKIFKSISNQKISSNLFKKKLQKSITEDLTLEEIDSFSSDLVISNATIEHVGSFQNQKKMIENMIKLSKKMIIIITPNRYHPIEFHTKLPLIHWLNKKLHRQILEIINFSFLAKESNLNLLSKKDFEKLAENQNINYTFQYIKFLLFKSNLIFIGKKIVN